MFTHNYLFVALLPLSLPISIAFAEGEPPPDYAREVAPLLRKYCAGCHNADDANGKLRLDEHGQLLKGGEHGPALLAGDAKLSRMMRLLTGEAEPKMPPEGEKQPTAAEIALIARWIDAGAKGLDGEPMTPILITPQLPSATRDAPLTAAVYSPDGQSLAVAKYRTVELGNRTGGDVRRLTDHAGKVNDLAFASDGTLLLAASGVTGLAGEVRIWNVADASLAGLIHGHRDAILAVAITPDGKTIATGSYDKEIILWDRATSKPLHTLTQHNGAIYDLAFSPDGTLLASASGDQTVKVWKVATGERLDTLGQPKGEQYAVLFSPDGQRIVAGGADNRIRMWRVVSRDKLAINPLLHARFAHEGAIVALAWKQGENALFSAADDRTLKLWDARELRQIENFAEQPDVVSAIAASASAKLLAVTRLDGSLSIYPYPPPPAPLYGMAALARDVDDERDTAPLSTARESEPNDASSDAMPVTVPVKVRGVIHSKEQGVVDADLFRFSAKQFENLILETNAARMKSPLDTHIEVLYLGGGRIERVKLQAVRESYFTFRGKDSTQTNDFRIHNWEEMKVNQYLYAQGEVVKLYHYPTGADSGFMVYPNFGKRHTWFDTTSVSHDLGEPCYVVQGVSPREEIIPNGLPVFPLYYENDDESQRKLGTDSKLTFTAPADGEYLVRVRDTRGFQGEKFSYELTIRRPKPAFNVTITGGGAMVAAGSGKMFTVNAVRDDDYGGEIRVDILGVPQGFYVTTPLVIEAGHWNAEGAIYAFPDAAEPEKKAWDDVKITATAMVDGKEVTRPIGNLGVVKLANAPKLLASLIPPGRNPAPPGEIPEITIERGQTITATLRLQRHGFDEVVSFGGSDAGRNLPHGVYVDNVGLNGVLLLANQNEREIFITADDWVPKTNRLFFLQSKQADEQCTWPVRLIVK